MRNIDVFYCFVGWIATLAALGWTTGKCLVAVPLDLSGWKKRK